VEITNRPCQDDDLVWNEVLLRHPNIVEGFKQSFDVFPVDWVEKY
jgi:hypothetical protein